MLDRGRYPRSTNLSACVLDQEPECRYSGLLASHLAFFR